MKKVSSGKELANYKFIDESMIVESQPNATWAERDLSGQSSIVIMK